MASTIDPTKPETGLATTASVRANFQAAKTEIEALQSGVIPSLTGVGLMLTFETVADMKAYDPLLRALMPTDALVRVGGYYVAGDGGGGTFRWGDASVAVANGGTVIAPDAGTGRWLRVVEDGRNYDFLMFGAKGDAVTDDIDAIMATIDAAKADGVGVEFSCKDYAVSRRIVVNGSDVDPDTDITGGNTAVLSFKGQGRSLFLSRFIAIGALWPAGHAVVTARNIAGKIIGNFQVDAAMLADSACDFAWIGTASGVPGTAAPSCSNEFSRIWAENARRLGVNLNQAADCKVSTILYRGGTAEIGVSMRLPGGGIWADTVFTGSGRFLVSCQNGGFVNCGFFSGIETTDAALNHIGLYSTHAYAFTPRRTLDNDSLATTNGSSTVVVSRISHGLKTGNFLELSGAVGFNGLAAADLNTPDATKPRPVTWLSEDTFSFEAGQWDGGGVFIPTLASGTGSGGGAAALLTGRGWTIYSSATSGDGPRSLEAISCYFNTLGVKGQKHFTGRWLNGARFRGCRFGGNSGDTATADVYFDTSGSLWTPSGALSSLPLFGFDDCGFSQGRPVSVANKVLVAIDGYYDGPTNSSVQLFERPGPVNFSTNAYDRPLRLNSAYVWNDGSANALIRMKASAPASATDGNVLLQRQVGSASPNTVVTPLFSAATFWDSVGLRLWFAYNAGNTNWTEFARRRDGSGSPIGAITATQAGSVYSDTSGAGKSWVSRAANNTDWDPIPRTFTGSVAKDWGSIAVGASLTQTVTCTGAVMGDFAQASMSIDLAGLTMTAYVSAADTVTVVLANLTAGAVDLLNGTLNVRVMRT